MVCPYQASQANGTILLQMNLHLPYLLFIFSSKYSRFLNFLLLIKLSNKNLIL